MARINIDDDWITDPRRTKLIALTGDEYLADGLMFAVWTRAQYFWRNGKHPIPKPEFDKIRMSDLVVRVKLAYRVGASYYVRGAALRFDWLIRDKISGREGGLASGRSRREKIEGNAKGTRREREPSISISSSITNTSSKSPLPPFKDQVEEEGINKFIQQGVGKKGMDFDPDLPF